MEGSPFIDKSSPIPLYYQLRQVLEYQIRTKEIRPGESMPGEAALCKQFGVSRTTVRQTISDMLKDGLLLRQMSRGRPVVAPVIVHQSLLRLQGFFAIDTLMSGVALKTKVVSVQKQFFSEAAAKLGLASNVVCHRIERVHFGNNEPLALQVSYIPASISENLDSYDLESSLFTYIERDYGKKITKAHQTIGIKQPGKYERELLCLPHKIPLFKVERISYAENSNPVEYFECYLRSDRYDFEMKLDRVSAVMANPPNGVCIND